MELKMYTYKNCDGPAERVIMGTFMFLSAVVGLWYGLIILLTVF